MLKQTDAVPEAMRSLAQYVKGNENIVEMLTLIDQAPPWRKDDPPLVRLKLVFKNGLQLSVVCGHNFFSEDHSPYEIAVIDKSGMTDEYFEGENYGDTVLGHCNTQLVGHYIKKIGELE